ncbi:RidA family protein [Mycolicibacterium psychrotolerans]|uniref:Enamine deaminase RidA n=1 Tax=Mycolicibacterium psychrotolerans TaxID=216929 RepID=A0A7I7MDY0_9MYCO|nr:RidA family protein [Mycolicibacterium psychrotolerans]BBX70531.1 enamine deaminase RidA [Mycolicibacterium psychrotolerans]
MAITLLNPEGLPTVEIYKQVAVATGSRLVFVAGQIARTAHGEPVGAGDLAAQVDQCFVNLSVALSAAGASFDDVAKLTVYLVDWTPDKMSSWVQGATRAAERLGITATPPLTGIGVAALAEPDVLVEVEAIAVLD